MNNSELLFASAALLASAFANALSVVLNRGIRSELKALKDLMESKIAGLEDDVEMLKNWREKFFVKGAHV